MKFLEDSFNNKNIMPLNIYYNRANYNDKNSIDSIDIIFKDMDTGRKYVHTIESPKIEVWITKEEYRNYSHVRNFFRKDYCYPLQVSYKNRYYEVAKHMGISPDDVKISPYVFQIDMQLDHFYMVNFLLEYPNKLMKKLSLGYLDIENDIIQVPIGQFGEPGASPINVVTYMDESTLNVYTFVLIKDDLPYVDEHHNRYNEIEERRKSYYEQADYFCDHLDDFKKELHEKFDESYGELNYNIIIFEDEKELIKSLFEVIKLSDNDYIGIWNEPYDMMNLIERQRTLGMNPNEIVCDKAFGERNVSFIEDKNMKVHKRKHVCNTYTMPTFIDQMVIYAGIRSARGKIPSLKLNAIARKELKDEKLDYSESGNIRDFYYDDFWNYIIYNIKDVLLQYGINRKTKDFSNAYGTIYGNAVLPNEIFTSTTILANSIRSFAFKFQEGYLMGINKNKIIDPIHNFDKLISGIANIDTSSVDYEEPDFYDISDFDDESDDEEEEEKFQGAHVQNPLYMTSTGYKIFGKESKYVHEDVIDEDITSEYPSAINIMNASNETLVAKVFLENPQEIDIEIFKAFEFKGDERNKYKLDISNFMMEVYSENDVLNFGHMFLNLPETTEVLSGIEENIKDFI